MPYSYAIFFFFNDTATTEIYTLSLHDALPISLRLLVPERQEVLGGRVHERTDDRSVEDLVRRRHGREGRRSEEHTSELQSHSDLVCRLLLEKKKKYIVF